MTTTTDITAQIRALQSTPPAVLADRYNELFGRPPRVRNAAWLRRQVAWRMQANAFGGLPERAHLFLTAATTRSPPSACTSTSALPTSPSTWRRSAAF
jgi:hypothetical protein